MEPAAPAHVLTFERVLTVSPDLLWRCWTEPALMMHWFCPPPWRLTDVRLELRPGGEFYTVMTGPDGQEHASTGVVLAVEPQRQLVFTDALQPGWVPSGRAFMVAHIGLSPEGVGTTRYVARAMHWDRQTLLEHEAMGFHDGWGKAAEQLEQLARCL